VIFIASFRIILQQLPKSLEAKRQEHEYKPTVMIYGARSENEENGIKTAKDKNKMSEYLPKGKHVEALRFCCVNIS
jgi:hypothetical protein